MERKITQTNLALTLAVIMGKESQHTAGLLDKDYRDCYQSASLLYKNNYIAVLVNGSYVIVEHNPTWNRRIR